MMNKMECTFEKSKNEEDAKSNYTISTRALHILDTLKGIEGKLDVVNKILFDDEAKEDAGCSPDCLDRNIDLALASAKTIERHLEKILERL